MRVTELRQKATDLEQSLPDALLIDDDFLQELLDSYAVNILALKSIDDSYPWERAIQFQERHDQLESRLAKTTQEEFDEYCVLTALLGVLYEEVPDTD